MKQLTLPVSDGAGELLELDLAGAAEVVDEEVAKHFARNAVLGHERLGRALQRDGQVRDRVTGDARGADGAVRQRRLVLDAAQTEGVDGSNGIVRVHLYVSSKCPMELGSEEYSRQRRGCGPRSGSQRA